MSASACGDGPGALGEGADLEHAHRAVPDDRLRRRRACWRTARPSPGRCPGPSSRPGSPSAAHDLRARRPPRTPSATTTSTGSTISTPFSCGLREVALDGLDLVGLEQRVADLVALRGEEGEAHAAADEQAVDLVEQVVDDAELVGDLRAAEHDHVRALRVVGQALRAPRPRSATRPPGGVRQQLRRRRRPTPACGARRRSRRRRRRRPSAASSAASAPRSASSLLVSRGVEADVLQQRDVAVARARRRSALRRVADGVGRRSATGVPSSSPSRAATGRERVLRRRARPSGRPRWAHDDDLGARVDAGALSVGTRRRGCGRRR